VGGAEDRAGLQPDALAVPPKVLAPNGRDYLAMNTWNMFTGYHPTPPPVVRETPPPRVVTEDKAEVLRFVKLTTLSFDPERKRWEAWLYDQGKGGKEKKVNTSALSELTIEDKDGNPMIEAKVVKIDEEFLVFLSEGKYYRLRLGDFLYPAIRTPLSNSALKEMGITPDESAKEKPKKDEDE